MGIEDQLKKSKFLGCLPLHCLPFDFCKTLLELRPIGSEEKLDGTYFANKLSDAPSQ